ncbi:hypothetical protein EJ02DRAFT_462439 [Clathrospora elynae]|uniref:Glycosyltransferase 2-like domain-containing protein n=1 Tax=Clathrospora elynae TaxID=706981 RepID=A0A6A5TBU6_9PLEO|nr:hypothetical protein EJ02DRAFT_462439 [Clathrospora elynae]
MCFVSLLSLPSVAFRSLESCYAANSGPGRDRAYATPGPFTLYALFSGSCGPRLTAQEHGTNCFWGSRMSLGPFISSLLPRTRITELSSLAMTAHLRLEDAGEKNSHDRQTTHDAFEKHRRLVWLMCATTSLLSARHILVEQNLHYPLQTYFNQIAATAFFAVCLYPWQRKVQVVRQEHRWKRSLQGTLIVAAAHCFGSLSMFLILQAILHTANLALLAMMITISFFAEDMILLATGYTSQSRVESLRLGLLLLACAGILSMEYRLGVPTLLAGILAMLFAGIANALKKLTHKHYPGDMTSKNAEMMWLVNMGSLVAIACIFGPWPREHVILFDLGSFPLRAVNACSTAAALLLGGSIFLPLDAHHGSQPPGTTDVPSQRVRDVLTLLALTGITGCFSTLSLRRSYTSWYQLCFFFIAILCIYGKDTYDTVFDQSTRESNTRGNYDLITYTLGRSDDSESNALVEDSAKSQLRTSQVAPRGFNPRSCLTSMALIMLWTAYVSLNFGQRQHPRAETRLDMNYEASVPLEVVISMYKEKADDVAQLISRLRNMPQMTDARITIYLKDSEADEQQIKQESNAHEVIKLPNLGREAETYLNHIVTRWESLAGQTIFLQADVHNSREFYPFVERYFRAKETGFLNLGWAGNVCNGQDCGDRFGWQDETRLFPAIQSRIDKSTRENVLLSYKGQFVATAARIRGIDKSIYNDLWQALVDENSWAHQEEYLHGREDSMSQPWFGYTMERIWNVLFQCSDMDIAWKCPTLLSGWRPGGSIADCQCFDS